MTQHKGSPRLYLCADQINEKGRVDRDKGCHWEELVHDGQTIPMCHCGKEMRKPRFKRVSEKLRDRQVQAKMYVGPVAIWTDVARRKARCHLCMEDIGKGEKRIAFDMLNTSARATKTFSGGIIKSNRSYVHATCFIDLMMGGTPGKGCPGCSAKVLNDEFRAYKKMLVDRAER